MNDITTDRCEESMDGDTSALYKFGCMVREAVMEAYRAGVANPMEHLAKVAKLDVSYWF